MARARAACSFAAALVPLTACHAPAVQPDAPARIVDATPESRAVLVQAVSDALNGRRVTLADDALTTGSALIIERATPHDLSGRELDGRELGRPVRFRLVLSAAQCVLVREDDGRRWVLRSTRCVAE